MVFRSVFSSHLSTLSLQQALEITNVYLENAYKTKDPDVALVLCHDAEAALSQAKSANKKYPSHPNDMWYQDLRQGVATAYIDLGKYLDGRGYQSEALAIYKKAEKWGGNANNPGRLAQLSRSTSIVEPATDSVGSAGGSKDAEATGMGRLNKKILRPKVATISSHIFAENVRPSTIDYKLPQPDERLTNTPQLVCCLALLRVTYTPEDVLEPVAQSWLQVIGKDTEEQERLHALSIEVIRVYKRDELKDAKAVAEVVCLAPVLNKDSFQDLLRDFYSGIDHSGLLNFQLLEGLAQLIQGADPGHLDADDLVKILELLSTRLRDTHRQSSHHIHQLTLAVSHVLDAMADTKVTGLDREKLHEPLSIYLSGLMKSSDPFLVYQAAYAYQALLCVPDNETTWQAAMRRTGKVVQGVAGLVSAVKGLDLEKFMDGLSNIQQGVDVTMVIDVVKTAYAGVSSLAKGGQGFVESLKKGLSFERRRDWYAALRGADTLIRDGELATFKKLVCGAPCRYDPAFQWGVCQRLGEMAANATWDAVTRRGAIAFLGEIYRDDQMWGQDPSIKQWILNILMQLASTGPPGSSAGASQLHAIVAEALLQDLEASEDDRKRELYRECRANGPIAYPLKVTLPELASPSLLDRVQNRPDVEGNIRVLRKQRTKERGNAVYIPPQAKPNIQASDDEQFPLMERMMEFLESDQRVFLLLGESGAGKSTFNRELEFQLWQSYVNKTGRIPLHVNLPEIEKPEHDMIAKQLRKSEFSEPQIREMRHHRRFILICDGYDESQQTHNLYVTNKLNQQGEWDAQMVISCRNEYLGNDYRDRFQPGGDRNTLSDSSLFQEAMVAPFTMDQVQAYIRQYVTIHQPLWRVEDYKQALDLIPSLSDLVKNPFLMTLSLDVLPRMVDPGQHLSSARVTRVALYDHFVEQWLERGKKRLGEKDMGRQTKAAFERLSAEGFTLNGIEFLKRFSVAIYKEQGGNPVVEYAQLVDERSWKDEFFRLDDKRILLEACPLTRNGNQHRFIHRSLLEYGLTRAIFDPQDRKNRGSSGLVRGRRGSTSSALSFEIEDTTSEESISQDNEPDPNSPLVWRSFVNDHSLLNFLVERVQQEPEFERQLRSYIEHSKSDKKWRKAAANAITILVRSGVQFMGADLRGIQIPGADLSWGVFDSAQLQGSDLRKVNLRGIWMREMDLSGAQMEGVQFGELLYLTEKSEVLTCAYSPDGRWFVVGLMSGDISVYSTSDWEKVMILRGHTNSVSSIVFSPDGCRIVSVSTDCTARVWDGTGSCSQFFIHATALNCVAYSPRGNQIAMGGYGDTLHLRDPVTGECIRLLSKHGGMVICAAYSPLGEKIVTGGSDNTIRLWNSDTGVCSHIIIGHSDLIRRVAFSPSGGHIASASLDGTVRLWDVDSGLCCHVIKHNTPVNSVAYSPKGDQVASNCYDSTIRVWDVETGVIRHNFTGHELDSWCVVYSPEGNHIASGSADHTVRLWAGVSHFGSESRDTRSFEVKFSSNGRQVAKYMFGNTIQLLDVGTGSCIQTLSGHSGMITSVAYSPKGDMMVSCDESSRSVTRWDVVSGSSRHNFTLGSDYFNYPVLDFSPQGDTIAVGCDHVKLKLFDVATGVCNAILLGHNQFIECLAYSPNSKLIVSCSFEGTVRLWDIESSSCRHTLKYDNTSVYTVIFSPQGHQFAAASYDKTGRIWDVETGQCLMILIGHPGGISSMAYSMKGDVLVTGGSDNEVRLWDVESGQCRAMIQGIHGVIKGIAPRLASEDIYVISRSGDGGVIMWKITNDDQHQLSVEWIIPGGSLIVTGASIQDARGLSQLSKQLLKQRGAKGEPESLLLESTKKVVAMASVLSKLKGPVDRTTSTISNADASDEHEEPQVKQTGEL